MGREKSGTRRTGFPKEQNVRSGIGKAESGTTASLPGTRLSYGLVIFSS